ncbi:MAG: sodium:proton exchanger [Nevskiaceae bacterium]|nr:MAG: sodium:proton exchanger [Nevskiaceae bacterium]TBR72258.1 MAG: sodium:proton exchanger [Nevskiaceae bacterium]
MASGSERPHSAAHIVNLKLDHPWARWSVQFGMLLVILALTWTERQWAAADAGVFSTIAAIGLLLLTGTLVSQMVERIGLPHLTGYLLAGMLVGPHVLGFIQPHSIDKLSVLNQLALMLIALAGGAELRVASLRNAARSLAWAHLYQMTWVITLVGGTFFALRGFIPFLADLPLTGVAAVAVLWGILAATRSPSALLAIMAQYRPKGRLTDSTVAFIMSSDVLIIVLLAIVMPLVQLALNTSLDLQQAVMTTALHLAQSTAIGIGLGVALILYLRLSGQTLLFVLLLMGLPASALFNHLHLDPLLSFMIAGFIVQNFSHHGAPLLRAIEGTAEIVFVVFFATAGAHLDLPGFASVWPIAFVLVAVRIAVTVGASRAASHRAGDPPVLVRWGWSGLVSQAGLALGIALILAHQFPAFGTGFATLAIGVVGVNEIIGPVCLKLALQRSGEISTDSRKH